MDTPFFVGVEATISHTHDYDMSHVTAEENAMSLFVGRPQR